MAYRIDVYKAEKAEWNLVKLEEDFSTALARAILASTKDIIRVQDGDGYTIAIYYNHNLEYQNT